MPPLSIARIVEDLDRRMPSGTAESWDNVGLLVGDRHWKTSGAIVSIDLTPEALEAAVQKKYRLIVNHHPCIFPKGHGLARVTASSGMQGLVFEAVRRGIAVVSAHTNFDQCALEVVNRVSDQMGVKPLGRLMDSPRESLTKLAVFVPVDHLEKVRDALFLAGAGQIGRYDSCSFNSQGTGSFRGLDGTSPFLGEVGRFEQASEVKLETVFPKGLERPVIQALLSAHPYEEVAYDIYSVLQAPKGQGVIRGLGYGFWGTFSVPISTTEALKRVRKTFQVEHFLFTGALGKKRSAKIQKIAFVAGKGSSFFESAVSQGCDLMITGEAGYHTALDASRNGMAVVELGHRESEIFFLKVMKGWLTGMGLAVTDLNHSTQKFE